MVDFSGCGSMKGAILIHKTPDTAVNQNVTFMLWCAEESICMPISRWLLVFPRTKEDKDGYEKGLVLLAVPLMLAGSICG